MNLDRCEKNVIEMNTDKSHWGSSCKARQAIGRTSKFTQLSRKSLKILN